MSNPEGSNGAFFTACLVLLGLAVVGAIVGVIALAVAFYHHLKS